jgi:hypothetical protein
VNKNIASRVREWKVEEEYPVISDHCTISMQLEDDEAKKKNKKINNNFPRWNFKKVNIDMLRAESMVWGMEKQRTFTKLHGRVAG